MLLSKQKKNQVSGAGKGNRILISISVIGSAGPIRFVVNEEDLVAAVIDTALKSYARAGRLPILGSNLNDFLLHCSVGTEALSPWETIGANGVRNFILCKKPEVMLNGNGKSNAAAMGYTPKGSGSWRTWFNKSLNLKISSH